MRKEKFMKDVERLITKYPEEFCEESVSYFNDLQAAKEEKELITEKGKAILKTMRELDRNVSVKPQILWLAAQRIVIRFGRTTCECHKQKRGKE